MKLLPPQSLCRQAGLFLSVLLPAAVHGQVILNWSTNLDQTVVLSSCSGPNRLPATTVTIPDTINGLQVTGIGANAFGSQSYFITNIVIPDSVNEIGGSAFWGCRYVSSITVGAGVTNLSNYAFAEIGNGVSVSTYAAPDRVSFYFRGNAPTLGSYSTNGVFQPDNTVFDRDPKATVYYLPGTTGWSDTFGGLPTAVWLPRMQQIAGKPSGSADQITFNIFWAKGRTVVIDCCSDLLNPAWEPIATNILTSSTWSFNGSPWASSSCLFYRARGQ